MKSKSIIVFFPILYPFALHTSLLLGRLDWAIGLFVILVLSFLFALRFMVIKILSGAVILSICGLLLAGKFNYLVYQVIDIGKYGLFLPPVVMSLVMCWWFARTLTSGQEALITRFSRLISKDIIPETIKYTRGLTWMWAIIFALIAVEAISLAIWASLETWSLFTNILNYVFVILLIIGEMMYRRYIMKRPISFIQFLKSLVTADYQKLGKG